MEGKFRGDSSGVSCSPIQRGVLLIPLLAALKSLEEGILSMDVARNPSGVYGTHLEITPYRIDYLDMHAGQKSGYHFGIGPGLISNERGSNDFERS
jgi:hypothetical protein